MYVGVGFDRVLLATVKKKGDLAFLVGRQALGDIDAIGLETFVEEFTRAQNAIGRAMNKRIDMALPPNTPNAFPQKLEYLAKDRMIYLLPVIYNYKPVGLFYLDRHVKKPKLTPREIKTVRLFRDFALMAIKKIRSK